MRLRQFPADGPGISVLTVLLVSILSPLVAFAQPQSPFHADFPTLTTHTLRALKRMYTQHEQGKSFERLVIQESARPELHTRLSRSRTIRRRRSAELDVRPFLNNASSQKISIVTKDGTERALTLRPLYSFMGSMRLRGDQAKVELFVYGSEVFGFASTSDGKHFDVRARPTRTGAFNLRSTEQREKQSPLTCNASNPAISPLSLPDNHSGFRTLSMREEVQFDIAIVTSCGMVRNAGSAERAAIFATAAVSAMNLFYRNEGRIRLNIIRQKVYSSCDTDPIHQNLVRGKDKNTSDTLTSFRTLAATMPEISGPDVDIAVLRFKALPGYSEAALGMAWISGACTQFRYAISLQFEEELLFAQERTVIAHEIGHLLGAQHHTCGMSPRDPALYSACPYIMQPSGPFSLQLGTFTVGQINTFLDKQTCSSAAPPRSGAAPYFDSGDNGRDEISLQVPEGLEVVIDLPIYDPDNDIVSVRPEWDLPQNVQLEGRKLRIFKPLDCMKPAETSDSLLLTAVDATGNETSGQVTLYYSRNPFFGTGKVDPSDPYGPNEPRETVLYPNDRYSKSFAIGLSGIAYQLDMGMSVEGLADQVPFTFDRSRGHIDWLVTANDIGRNLDIKITAERCGEKFEVHKKLAVLSEPGVPAVYKQPASYFMDEVAPARFIIKVISGASFTDKSFELTLLEPRPAAAKSLDNGILTFDVTDDFVKGCRKDKPYELVTVPIRLTDPTTGKSSVTNLEIAVLNSSPPQFSGLVDRNGDPLWKSRETWVSVDEVRTLPIRFDSTEPDLPYTISWEQDSKEYARFDATASALHLRGIWPPDQPMQVNSSAYRPITLNLQVCPQDGSPPSTIQFYLEVRNWTRSAATPTPEPTPTSTSYPGSSQSPTPSPTAGAPRATPKPTLAPNSDALIQ